ncbi:hypothetical protein VUR80DRAFT_1512 [Thermomyces stellatus]
MPAEDEPRPRAKPSTSRVSLACIPCRIRHVRCDATRPYCRRCLSCGKECRYEKSRRGGLDRETLAARRSRQSQDAESSASSDAAATLKSRDKISATEQGSNSKDSWHPVCVDDGSGGPEPPAAAASVLAQPYQGFDAADALRQPAGPLDDPLIKIYYGHFHTFHPYILPRQHLQIFLQDPTKRPVLESLVSVIRLIGSIYGRSSDSPQLKEQARRCHFDSHSPMDTVRKAFMVQSRLLLSIALYWSTDIEESRSVLDCALRDAFELGMYCREFAVENSEGDPVLAESWRRTWWQLYIVDAYYAAIRRSPQFLSQDVEATVDLPCEEREYESGVIPAPKTLHDFENREFAPDDPVFSSFAYLIGAIRCVASATAVAPQSQSHSASAKVIEGVDAIVNGWFLLLPESKRQLMSKEGVVDELMFQAHMGLHAYAASSNAGGVPAQKRFILKLLTAS